MVAAEDQPFENSPDGLIKHLVHEKMGTREQCVDAYMLFIEEGGRSGKHRHMWEEVIFVAEGSGYDLHWDVKFDCIDTYHWDWETEPRKSEWQRGDFIYIPPFSIHQHFNTGKTRSAADRHQQPHRQGDGLQLARSGGERPGRLRPARRHHARCARARISRAAEAQMGHRARSAAGHDGRRCRLMPGQLEWRCTRSRFCWPSRASSFSCSAF